MTGILNSANAEDVVGIPVEIANALSDNQKDYLNQCSITVRQHVVKIDEVLSLPQHEKKLGDFYMAFRYLEEALLCETSPYVTVSSVMDTIARYSVAKNTQLFARKGEINEARKLTESTGQ